MEENTFYRTEHLGTENLGVFHKKQSLWIPNSISICFLPYHTLQENANKNQTTEIITLIWIEKMLQSNSNFLYLKKNVIKSTCCQHWICGLRVMWDVFVTVVIQLERRCTQKDYSDKTEPIPKLYTHGCTQATGPITLQLLLWLFQ